MQLVRVLACYYRRQRQVHHDSCQQVFAVRQVPQISAFEKTSSRRLATSASSSRGEGVRAHISAEPKIDGKDSAEGFPLPPAAPRKPRFYDAWKKWTLGSLLAFVISLWSTRWQKLLLIGSELENAVKVAETAAELVEEVATAVEKVSAEVAGKLPEDGKLKRVALAVEKASVEAAAGAQTVEIIMHKVDELEEQVKTLIKPEVAPRQEKTQRTCSSNRPT